jgi:hypothetical protein
MPQVETMTLDEKLAISCKAAALRQAGDEEGSSRLLRTDPMDFLCSLFAAVFL